MNKDKQVTLVAGLLGLLFLAWIFTDISQTVILGASGVTVASFILFHAIQHKQISSFRQRFQNSNPQGNLDGAIGIQELKNTLNTWAAENYGEDNHIQITWDFTDYDTKPLRDWDEVLAAVTGAVGQNDRFIQVFIELNSGRVTGHKVVRTKHQFKRPFKYSDYFQEYKRKTRTGSDVNFNPGNQAAHPAYMWNTGGMPPRSANRQNQGKPDDTDEE